MKLRHVFFQVFIMALFGCTKEVPLPTPELICNATKLAVERMNSNISQDFELCGHYCSSWTDSTLINALVFENLQDVFSNDDYKYMSIQYNNLKNKDIINYLPKTLDYIKEDNQGKHLDVHICISPPLFSITKNSWVIFHAVFTRKGYDEFFVVYKINPRDESMTITLHSNDRLITIKDKQHSHAYWLSFIKHHI